MKDEAEQKAEAILPCEHLVDQPGYYNDPSTCVACAKRPAVASALREAQQVACKRLREDSDLVIDNLRVKLAERDAAYERGLERGRDIAYDYENADVTEWEAKYGDRLSYEAIQAEIDKAKGINSSNESE